MKLGSVLTCLVGSAVLLSAAATDPKVTFIPHDKVAKGGTLVAAPDLTVLISHRASRGEAEVHDKETDTFYVLDGSATLITGGTMVGGRVTAPNQHRAHPSLVELCMS